MKKILLLLLASASLSALAGTSPSWPNSYTAPDGTLWSDRLPQVYANCISEKDANGNAIVASNGLAVCQRDANGDVVGASGVMVDSDAIEVCKKMGGELPSNQDVDSLGANIKFLHNGIGGEFWTVDGGTAFGGHNIEFADTFGFDGAQLQVGYLALGSLQSVRCLAK